MNYRIQSPPKPPGWTYNQWLSRLHPDLVMKKWFGGKERLQVLKYLLDKLHKQGHLMAVFTYNTGGIESVRLILKAVGIHRYFKFMWDVHPNPEDGVYGYQLDEENMWRPFRRLATRGPCQQSKADMLYDLFVIKEPQLGTYALIDDGADNFYYECTPGFVGHAMDRFACVRKGGFLAGSDKKEEADELIKFMYYGSSHLEQVNRFYQKAYERRSGASSSLLDTSSASSSLLDTSSDTREDSGEDSSGEDSSEEDEIETRSVSPLGQIQKQTIVRSCQQHW